jgi:FHS family glucose/mannose:H+ symporter-like MFS transporter
MDRRLNQLGLAGYLLIGGAAVLIPSVMPSITDEFTAAGLTLATLGLIFPARSAGSMLGGLLAGVVSDRTGHKWLVWVAALLLGVVLALAAVTAQWTLFVVGFVLISAATSALSTGINAMVADVNQERRGQALNTLHAVYGVGAAVSPLLIGYLIENGLAWRWALGGSGLIWLVYGVGAYLTPGGEAPRDRGAAAPGWSWSILRQGPLLALFLIAFIYNGVAYSLLGWVAVFMEEAAGFTTFFAVSMISVFYVALTIGRFLCAAYSERIGYAATFQVLGWGITLTYPLVIMVGDPWIVVVGIFLTGLSLSGLFPTALAYGARLLPHQTGTVTGMLNVAMTLGAMIPPVWTGLIAAQWGLQVALGVNYFMAPPLLLLAIYLGRRETRTPTDRPAPQAVR